MFLALALNQKGNRLWFDWSKIDLKKKLKQKLIDIFTIGISDTQFAQVIVWYIEGKDTQFAQGDT